MDVSPDALPFFVLVGLENNVKSTFQVKTLPVGGTVNFRVNVGMHLLQNVVELGKIIS